MLLGFRSESREFVQRGPDHQSDISLKFTTPSNLEPPTHTNHFHTVALSRASNYIGSEDDCQADAT